MTNEAQRNEDTVEPLVRRRFLSDYGAAWIGEGIAFAGLCIGCGIARAEAMWALVILWAFFMGPSKSLRDTSNPTGLRCAGLGAHKQDPVVGGQNP